MSDSSSASDGLDDFLVAMDDDETELQSAAYVHWSNLKHAESSSHRRFRGSVHGRRTINRRRHEGCARMIEDYYIDHPIYHEGMFRRRFRMSRRLFLRIADAVLGHDKDYFEQRPNAAMQMGIHPLVKMTGAIRMLAYGRSADSLDEYLRIAAPTIHESTRHFVRAVVEVFGPEYLRAPTEEDTRRLLMQAEMRGFPGMLGSIDCMHWEWKNCPTAFHGVYTGHGGGPTLILEAVAAYDGWIWHSFFGVPSSNNDINVLHRSLVFDRLIRGEAPEISYTINGREYQKGYYLADGIYPEWTTLMKNIAIPLNHKEANYSAAHSAVRKDIERAFGQLQARWHILRESARPWDVETLQYIMSACIILHNMIVEDEGGLTDEPMDFEGMGTLVQPAHGGSQVLLDQIFERHLSIRDSHVHRQRRILWSINGCVVVGNTE